MFTVRTTYLFAIPFLLASASTFAEAPSIDGCVPTRTETVYGFDDSIPETPTAAAQITIPVSISGNGKIIDVDFSADINHNSPSHLTFSLISPAGTEVTLSDNNNSTLSDIYNGIDFDDQSDKRLAELTSSNWKDGVAVGKVQPDEPLGTFKGETPNGNWILKIQDETVGTTGGLLDGILTITTCSNTTGSNTAQKFSNTTSTAIADNVGAIVRSTVTVTGLKPSLCKVIVNADFTHTFPGDIVASLISPQGKEVLLTDDIGSTNDNYLVNVTFTEGVSGPALADVTSFTANTSYPPLSPLSRFDGIDPNGTWTLKVFDDFVGDTGTLNSWNISLQSCSKDTDADGLGDNNDTCPSDPAKTAPGTCGCGVADSDADSNSIADCLTGDEFITKVEALEALLKTIKVPSNSTQRTAALKKAKSFRTGVRQLLTYAKTASPAISFTSTSATNGALSLLNNAANSLATSVTSRNKSSASSALRKVKAAVND